MESRGNISDYRSKLDKTLASADLTNDEMIHTLVKNQILQSSDHQLEEYTDYVVERRSKDISNFLTYVSQPFQGSNADFGQLQVYAFLASQTSTRNGGLKQFQLSKSSSQCVQRVGIGEQILLVRMKVSWPLSSREVLVHSFAFEYLQDGLVVVLLNSISNSETIGRSTHGFTSDGIPDPEDVVRIDLVGGFALQKVSATRSYFRKLLLFLKVMKNFMRLKEPVNLVDIHELFQKCVLTSFKITRIRATYVAGFKDINLDIISEHGDIVLRFFLLLLLLLPVYWEEPKENLFLQPEVYISETQSKSAERFRCWNCGADAESAAPFLFCRACRSVQPVDESIDYFQIFGLGRTYKIEVEELEKKYKDWQKKLHPDLVHSKSQLQEKLQYWSDAFDDAYVRRNYEDALASIRRMTYYRRANEEIVKKL
ncbi:UNVERIFIED_CONTAM: Iron-sulfur cluster co-chaperone protein HscB [Sesamum radiatum]|uniref:Iron-sulfur cluster co-chaperone protein HscB n=1 Tax=Sesamum radiatum TaxID=300843 RepID=A0AAW2R3B7_SESRA